MTRRRGDAGTRCRGEASAAHLRDTVSGLWRRMLRPYLNRWLPPLVWMGGIFFLSAQSQLPQAPDPLLNILLKKLAHALAYGILAWLYLRGLAPKGGSDRLRLLALVLAVAYAASDEFHQSFTPGRHPSLVDVSIDGVGAMTALLLQRRWVLAAARS